MTEDIETQTPNIRSPQPNFLTQTVFSDFDLHPNILAGLDEAGFVYCTPIQAQVLPLSLTGRDVAGQAQTGTGKTAVFLVTIFARLLARKNVKAGLPGALVVAPTRELALQIHQDAEILGKYTGLTLGLAIGGIDYQKQAQIIRQGPDIVICTPGRIIDYLNQGIFKTSGIEILVIDEADRLMDLGFIKDLRYLLRKLPHYDKRQSFLFSATLSYRVLELTYEYMNLPEFISVTPEEVVVEGIDQSLFHVGKDEKLPLLLGILEREDWSRILIFVNTKVGVDWLAAKLKGNGLPAEAITGDLPQRQRLKIMEQFKEGGLKILVATDVASRGIHVEDISHVINYDLPQDAENYVHRIGRTARAGKFGKAISLACEVYVFHLGPLEEMLGFHIPVVWHDETWLKQDLAGNVRMPRRDRRERMDKPGLKRGRTGPVRGREKEEKKGPVKKKPPRSSRPGGVFGLAPASRFEAEVRNEDRPDDLEETKKKKRRRRHKKKTSAAPPVSQTEAEGPEPAPELPDPSPEQ